MIRFIHAADLHLDTPFSGLEQTSKKLAEKLRERLCLFWKDC